MFFAKTLRLGPHSDTILFSDGRGANNNLNGGVQERMEHRSVNLAIARYGPLVEMLLERSDARGGKDDEELAQRSEQAVAELVEARQIGVLAGLLQLMGGYHRDLQQVAIEKLSSLGEQAVSAIVEEVTSRPTAVGAPGALLMLALMGTSQALTALDTIWSRLDLPYTVRARSSRLLTACRTGFFEEQRGFSEEIEHDAQTVRDLLEVLGGTVLSPLSAFRMDWLGSEENIDFNLALLSLSSFIWRRNEFCNLLRTHGFEDECLLSDQKAIGQALACQKPYVYPCYAGLTDIVIPTLDDGKVIGTLMTGQILTKRPTKTGFRHVCARLGRLPAHLRTNLEDAYLRTPWVEKAELEQIIQALQVVARLLLDLWHKTHRSLQKTKQLHRLEYLRRRELIETILFGEITESELETRLRDLGIASTPNFAVLVQLADLEQRTWGEPERLKMLSFERAALVVAEHLEHKTDALVAPLRYGEIVGLMELPPARNPHLARLRQKELGETLATVLRDKASLTATIGIGHIARGVSGLRESFEKAREALSHALTDGTKSVVHVDEVPSAVFDEVAQFSRLESRAAAALCGDDEDAASRVAGELLALLQVHSGRDMSRGISLLVSIVGSAAELATKEGATSGSLFPIKLEFLERVRSIKEPAERGPFFADLRRALRKAIARAQVGRVEQRIALARDYLDHHFAENVSREELAAHVGMSPWHLTTSFRRIVRMSPRDYLHRTRIEAAKKRLLTTTESIEDIAYAVGYGASANFRRMFQKWVGCSPTMFRNHPVR